MNNRFIILLIVAACFVFACNKITVDIPVELQGNEQAVEYITDLNKTIAKFNKLTIDLAQITGGKDINSSDSLGKMQMLKLAKTGGQFMLVSKKIEELIDNKEVVEAGLNAVQKEIFQDKCSEIEAEMGNIDLSELGFSKEQIAELKQKFDENKDYNEKQRLREAQKEAYYDSLAIANPEALEVEKYGPNHENVDHHPSKKKKTLFFIAFGLACLAVGAGAVFAIITIIKKLKNLLR